MKNTKIAAKFPNVYHLNWHIFISVVHAEE